MAIAWVAGMPRTSQMTKRALLFTTALATLACVTDEAELLELEGDDPELVGLDEGRGELLAPDSPEAEPCLFELPEIDCTTVADANVCQNLTQKWIWVGGAEDADMIEVRVYRDYVIGRVRVEVTVYWGPQIEGWASSNFNFNPDYPWLVTEKPSILVELGGGNDFAEVKYYDIVDGQAQLGVPSDNTTVEGGSGDDDLRNFRNTYGDDGADEIRGTSEADYIEGGSGADYILALGGDDEVFGQGGADEIEGGNGHNVIHGGDGKDSLTGGTGVDELYGNANDDRLWGFGGDDILRGNGGEDYLSGGNGTDDCDGGNGNDTFEGCP